VTFGKLFTAAAQVMEAVSGTLKTAKKHKVVSFEAEVLFQGMSDDVIITLLKEEISDSSVDTYTYRQVRACSIRPADKKGAAQGGPKTQGFGQATQQGQNVKCAACNKTVYAMEYIGVSGKGLHKSCFRCTVCTSRLRQDNYATIDDVLCVVNPTHPSSTHTHTHTDSHTQTHTHTHTPQTHTHTHTHTQFGCASSQVVRGASI
jgi:hypothetical protein